MVTLEASKPFRSLSRMELTVLRQIVSERSFAAGQQIFNEGDKGDGVYVVKDGLVEISLPVGPDARRPFARVGPGEIFGEMAVLELKPRSAGATAVQDSTVYFIPRGELLAMVQRSPGLALELLRETSERLRQFNQRYIQEILQAERLAIIGRFVRTIVHDLKNPLNIIGITAEMAGMDNAAPDARTKSAVTIRKQVDRINDMVGEILEFTQGSRNEYVLAPTDYRQFIQQLYDDVQPEAELRGVRVELDGPPPPVRLLVDPKRLRRVFQNLIHNSLQAMPEGGRILIRFQLEGAELVTEIQDTGRGIPPEMRSRLFEAFATFGKANGTGLGLCICKRIIEDHHGRIWAAANSGRGATFAFALPLTNHA